MFLVNKPINFHGRSVSVSPILLKYNKAVEVLNKVGIHCY